MDYSELIGYLYKNQVLSVLGTFASIISFLMTIYVTYSILKIRKFYIFNTRVPEIICQLETLSSEISAQLNTFDEINTTVSEILAKVEANLASLSRKVDRPLKIQANDIIRDISMLNGKITLINKIKTFFENKPQNQEKQLQKIYLSLYLLIAQCRTRFDDAKWEQST